VMMGREIRRVPIGWEHPKERKFDYFKRACRETYHPLHDEPYRQAIDEWIKNYHAWNDGTHEDFAGWGAQYPNYWEWGGGPPDPEYYRPEWTEEQQASMGFCMYENVSEGTPVSPVFATKEEIADWLVEQGHSRASAAAFVDREWAPSFVMTSNPDGSARFSSGVDAMGDD